MADPGLVPRGPLAGIGRPGRIGAADGPPGVTVAVRRAVWLASVLPYRNGVAALDEAAKKTFGCALPRTPRLAHGAGISFAWCGPAEWLAIADAPVPLLAEVAAGHAAVVAQGAARVILRVAGPRARDALAKGVPIDLHPRAFGPDDTAVTLVAHIGVQVWQVHDAPTYDLVVPRGYAGSAWAWLTAATAEFGCQVMEDVT